MTDNVIKFPKKDMDEYDVDVPNTAEEFEKTKDQIKNQFFDFLSIEFSAPLFNRACMHGFDISDESHILDCMLVVESIKSLLLKSKDLHHPLQDYAKNNITCGEDQFSFSFQLDEDEE